MTVEAGSASGRLDVDAHVTAMGFGFTQLLVTAYAAACWYADAGEVMILSYLAPAVRCSWALGPGAEASLSSVVFASMLVGVPLLGALSDRRGRRPALLLSMVVMVVAGLASAAATSFLGLAVARAFVGFALGGTPVAVTLMAESIPQASRGRWLMAMQGAWTAGAVGAALVAGLCFLGTRARGPGLNAIDGARLLLADAMANTTAASADLDFARGGPAAGPPHASPATAGWRALLVAAAIPLVLLLPATRALSESAHWLASHGRLIEARETLEHAAAVNARWSARLGAALGAMMGVGAGGRGGGEAPTGTWVDPHAAQVASGPQSDERSAVCTGTAYSAAPNGSGTQPGAARRPGTQGAASGAASSPQLAAAGSPQPRGRARSGAFDDLGPVLRTISFPPTPAVERARRARSASASRSLARPPLPPKRDGARAGGARSRSSSPNRLPRRGAT